MFEVGHKYNSRARLQAFESREKEYYRKAIAVWERLIKSSLVSVSYWKSNSDWVFSVVAWAGAGILR